MSPVSKGLGLGLETGCQGLSFNLDAKVGEDQDQDLIQWQKLCYGKYTHTAIFKSILCIARCRSGFISSLQSWLQCECLLIMLGQWLMFTNLHLCGFNFNE